MSDKNLTGLAQFLMFGTGPMVEATDWPRPAPLTPEAVRDLLAYGTATVRTTHVPQEEYVGPEAPPHFMSVVTICMEDRPGHRDPLIYEIRVRRDATENDIAEAALQLRVADLDRVLTPAEVRDQFRVVLAWRGTMPDDEYLLDRRT